MVKDTILQLLISHQMKKLPIELKKKLVFAIKKTRKWEHIKKFEITPNESTIDNGHLTPTIKIRKKIILKKYENIYQKTHNSL